jgi:hypothetical protein
MTAAEMKDRIVEASPRDSEPVLEYHGSVRLPSPPIFFHVERTLIEQAGMRGCDFLAWNESGYLVFGNIVCALKAQ